MAKRRASGDGMVRKRENGRWEGRIVVGHKRNGEPIFRSVYARAQKELLDKLHREIVAYEGVELTEDSLMTLGDWLDRWLDEYAANALRHTTLENYRHMVEQVRRELGDKQVSSVTTEDVQRMYRPLRERGRLVTGATKTGSGTRDILLADSTAELLRKRRETSCSEWIFPNPKRPELPLSPSSAYSRLKAILSNANLPDIRFHNLRHTFSTYALKSGVDAEAILRDAEARIDRYFAAQKGRLTETTYTFIKQEE